MDADTVMAASRRLVWPRLLLCKPPPKRQGGAIQVQLTLRDVGLLSIDAREELDRLIAHHWLRFAGRLSRLLEEQKESGAGHTGD
jgi:hypothetical protein